MSSPVKLPSFIKSTISRIKTKAGYRQANHLWIIDDFEHIHVDRGVKLYSRPFSANDVFQWQLKLYPNSYPSSNIYDSSCISLGIDIYEDYRSELIKHFPVTGKFKASIMNFDNQEVITKSMNFTKSRYSSEPSDTTFRNFMKKDYLFAAENKLLPQDRLAISCEIIYIKQSDVISTSGKSFSFSPLKLKETQPTGLEDFEKLFRDEEFADVTLLVNGKKYRAHKAILAARSPVFKAILRADKINKKADRIEINDVDRSVFLEMLRYIYTGNPQNLKKTVVGLLEAADKYELEQLKVICVKELIKNLSKDNLKDTLSLADKYNCKDLKTAATQFSKINFLDNHVTNGLTDRIREVLASVKSRVLGLDVFGHTYTFFMIVTASCSIWISIFALCSSYR